MKSSEIYMEALLELALESGASDLHLTVGRPPVLRLHGALETIDCDPLEPADTERLLREIATEEHVALLHKEGGADFAYAFRDSARFRVSLLRQKGVYGLVLRLIPSTLLTLEQIGLPPQVRELLDRPRGLILVTGPTGSGKSTTLASMIDIINTERDCHIITVEDPIEYYHPHKKSIVTQREVGHDVPSFKEALRRALRQDPDVILVGELRDLETMEAAISAAETGHLVFATLHTTGAAPTVDRILDAFPPSQQAQIRTQLASSLVAVISQVLMPARDGNGRVAALEIMIATPSIRALIRDNKTFRIASDIQTGSKWGMQTLDAHLFSLYRNGRISRKECLSKAQNPDDMLNLINQQA